MKKNSFLWAALSMTAALAMTACSNDDNDMTEAPVAPSTSKTIPYTVTVGGDEATTRATVGDDNRTLKFATGDKLYITGTNIQGVLYLKSGDEGKASDATFSGELTYDGSPADDLSLTATLVSAQQADGSEVTINATTGAVTVNYPTTAYCSSINGAVQKYSNLTGTSTFEDGTATNTPLTAVVNNNSSDICSASVTTETVSENVVAKFVLPVAAGTTLSSAKVTMGSKAAISFGASQTLDGKVYNVKKTQAAAAPAAKAAAEATAEDKGKLIGTDGNIYADVAAATAAGTTAVAKIIYIGTTGHATYNHGLALALTDEDSRMLWQDAIDACSAKNSNSNTPVTNATWLLASKDQWNHMLGADGAGSYTALRDGFSGITGADNLQSSEEDPYWSSTAMSSTENEYNPDHAWFYHFGYGNWYTGEKGHDHFWVRACLAF